MLLDSAWMYVSLIIVLGFNLDFSSYDIMVGFCNSSHVYLLKAQISHWPRVWIAESLRPDSGAMIVAPILKLCPV